MKSLFSCMGLAGCLAALPVMAGVSCAVTSGARTAALVELYTSEGCSSCPPADRQLSRLQQALGPDAVVVPLSLHVDYWDYIGWKDPYAMSGFTHRQSALTAANHHRDIYTPEFFVSGSEVRDWRDDLRTAVARTNAQAVTAQIHIQAELDQKSRLILSAEANTSRPEPTELYLTVIEGGLSSKVNRGENQGATLGHDHVARAWIGPLALNAGSLSVRREIQLPPEWNRSRLEVAGFVQEKGAGRVLQAVRSQQCFGS